MPYAVLQTDLDTPSVEQLRRAARSVPGLTAIDASILGADAYGILVKDFSESQAAALQGALRVEGVETEIVDQSILPELPQGKLVHRLDCLPQHLLIYDPLGRPFVIEWPLVMIVAAGCVRVSEFVRTGREPRSTARPAVRDYVEYETHEQCTDRCLAEIIVTGAVMRFSLNAEKFNFAGLGVRQTADPVQNFALLMRDAAQFSTHAGRNRGAETLHTHTARIFSYPTRNAFYEEIVWMLWQIKKAG